jgi:hypothetical protein
MPTLASAIRFLRKMRPASRSDSARTPPVILKPYHSDAQSRSHRRVRALIGTGLAVFCFFEGAVFALYGLGLIAVLVLPMALLALVILWALPETIQPPKHAMEWAFFALFITLVMWPNYLAIALPGLPWITLIRLTGFPMTLCLLISLSVSRTFRSEMKSILAAAPVIWILLLLFVTIQFVSIGLSNVVSQSVQKFIVAQISWTAVFFVACYVFTKQGLATRMVRYLWTMVIIVGLISLVEFRLGHVPWTGHVPGFLKISDPSVAAIMQGQMRAYTGRYRVQGTFDFSIALGEYVAVVFPFVFNALGTSPRVEVRRAALATIPFMFFIAFLTNSRSGMLGSIIGMMLYLFCWGVLKWKRDRASIVGPALVIAYPVIGVIFLASTLFVGRLKRVVWGGAEANASTEGRVVQWRMGWPLISKRPWGYGIGRSGETLNFHQPNGLLTIDSYYLTVFLEYGVVGFVVYYGMLLTLAALGFRYGFANPEKEGETQMLIPISISLLVFMFIKSVFSQQDNHPLIFMLMGMSVALIYRVRKSIAAKKAAAQASPA